MHVLSHTYIQIIIMIIIIIIIIINSNFGTKFFKKAVDISVWHSGCTSEPRYEFPKTRAAAVGCLTACSKPSSLAQSVEQPTFGCLKHSVLETRVQASLRPFIYAAEEGYHEAPKSSWGVGW